MRWVFALLLIVSLPLAANAAQCDFSPSDLNVVLGSLQENGGVESHIYPYVSESYVYNNSACLVLRMNIVVTVIIKGKPSHERTVFLLNLPPGARRDFTVKIPAVGWVGYNYSADDVRLEVKEIKDIEIK